MRYRSGMASKSLTPAHSSVAVPVRDRGRRVLESLVAAWLASYASANTRQAYARDVRDWLAFTDEHDVDPLAATRPHVDIYARVLESRGLRPTTRARRLATVSSMYAYAVAEGIATSNPAAAVRRPRTGEGHVRLTPALDRDELGRLIAAATSPRDRALVLVLTVLALRVSEALSLELGASEHVRGHVAVVIPGKGGREDEVPLPPLVLDALAELARHEGRTTGPVFVGEDGQRLSRHGVARALARLGHAAGIARTVRPHMLRATAITCALDAGVSLRDVQDLARHSDPRTTRRYDRNRGALDRHAAYALAALVGDRAAS